MNSHYTYFIIHIASLTLPLLLSFDKKVAFYRKWKYLFPAMVLPAIIFIAWDSWFARKGVWSFNEDYITGWRIINLPVEEILFFFTVPYCCVFIYECVRCYFPKLRSSRNTNILFILTGLLLLVTGIVNKSLDYTFFTFTGCGIFMLLIFLLKKFFRGFDALLFLISWLIILIPFLIVNGFLTALPVVIYNDSENLGLRIFFIPFEDIFYGMLLVLMNISVYERLRK